MLQMGTLRPTAWEGGTLRASVGLPGGPLRPERFGSAWVRGAGRAVAGPRAAPLNVPVLAKRTTQVDRARGAGGPARR